MTEPTSAQNRPEGDNLNAELFVSSAIVDARSLINAFIVDFDVITVLIKAMQLSGWVFHMKVLYFFYLDVLPFYCSVLGKSLSCSGPSGRSSVILR